ncbi:hypothetical protein DFJ77DRAFT_136746 [Powellomyces hirtus]|nr:hypothetical protein DFJ77DRAFT_136746 [Powellomyces hirtus]
MPGRASTFRRICLVLTNIISGVASNGYDNNYRHLSAPGNACFKLLIRIRTFLSQMVTSTQLDIHLTWTTIRGTLQDIDRCMQVSRRRRLLHTFLGDSQQVAGAVQLWRRRASTTQKAVAVTGDLSSRK